MKVKDILIRVIRKLYQKGNKSQFLKPECDCDRQSSNDKIYNLLISGEPCMISRFGTTELNCINNYLCVKRGESHFWAGVKDYITDLTHTPWWNTDHFIQMVMSQCQPFTFSNTGLHSSSTSVKGNSSIILPFSS